MKKRSNFQFIWFLAIALCMVLTLFGLIFAACSIIPELADLAAPTESASPSPEATPEPSPSPVTTPPPVSGTILGETADMGQEYVDKFIFIGDSTTYGLKSYGMLSGGTETLQVWTPASGTLTLSQQSFATIVYPESGGEITIKAAAELKKPEYMLITLGVNGVSFMDETSFKTEYTNLVRSVQEVSPDTKIIINSIYPTCSDYQHRDSISLEKILAANEWLKAVAEDTGVKYLDTISVLQGPDGYLPYELSNGDGIHLSPAGFTKVLDYLRTHGYEG